MGAALLYLSAYSPWAVNVTQLVAACYLLHISYTLWQRKNSTFRPIKDSSSGLYLFLLTVMNPKGLLIVSFIAPIGAFTSLGGYAGFMTMLALVIVPVGMTWVLLGSRFRGSTRRG